VNFLKFVNESVSGRATNGDHTMTDRVLLALALALLALTIAAVILYVAGVAPFFVG
jgi:hypothetical protein